MTLNASEKSVNRQRLPLVSDKRWHRFHFDRALLSMNAPGRYAVRPAQAHRIAHKNSQLSLVCNTGVAWHNHSRIHNYFENNARSPGVLRVAWRAVRRLSRLRGRHGLPFSPDHE